MRTTVTCFSIPRSHRSSKYTRRSARTVRCWIALADEAPLPAMSIPALSYETLLAPHEGAFDWRGLDERTATFLLQVGHDGKSRQPKYLNDIIEQDHRALKQRDSTDARIQGFSL